MKKKDEITNTETNIIVSDKKPSLLQTMTKGQRNVLVWAGIGLGVLGAGALAFHFLRKGVRKSRANSTENAAFGDNKHATWAKQFQLGFENDMSWGMGTNEQLIRKTMIAIPSIEDYEKVEKEYTKLTSGNSLPADLASELSSSEYEEILAIKMQKPRKAKDANGQVLYSPELWAKRLYAAMDYRTWGLFWGTDDDAIAQVFSELPTFNAFKATASAYKRLFPGYNLVADLDDDVGREVWSKLLANQLKK